MTQQKVKKPAPGFFRRMGAIFYDSVLLFGVLFVATALLLPLNNGQAFERDQLFYPLYLMTVSFFFFAWFWTHGGQTLGMRAWKIKVNTLENRPIGWGQALARFILALISWGICGLGFLWILVHPRNMSWHDILSKTRVDWQVTK